VGDGGLAGVAPPGEGASSSSAGEVGESTRGVFVILLTREEPERPLAIELASPLSLLYPSTPAKVEPEALGLSLVLSSDELLILLRIEDLIDLDVLSFVSDFEMEGYCCKVSGTRLDEDELFIGVLLPSLLFDCCWPIEYPALYDDGRPQRRRSETVVERSRRFEERDKQPL